MGQLTRSSTTRVLVITGPCGVGKTSVMHAIGERLEAAGVERALIDVDALREAWPAPTDDPFNERLGRQNLASLAANYRATGINHLILADIVEEPRNREDYRQAIPGARIQIVRLHASQATIEKRVTIRGGSQSEVAWHAARAAELAAQWQRVPVEDLLVDTEGISLADVAEEILQKAVWVRPKGTPLP